MIWAALAAVAALLFARRSSSSGDSGPAGADADPAGNVNDPDMADSTPVPDMVSVSDSVRDLALAIAHAEGFFVSGSIPMRANNPGDLVIPGWTGAKLGDQGISVFVSPATGWNRLHHQLSLIVAGQSHVYTMDDTIAAMGRKWAGGDPAGNWARNVVEYLQSKGYDADADTTLGEFLD